MNYGDEQFHEPEPLSAQEQHLIEEIRQRMARVMQEYREWRRTVGNRNVSAKVHFNATVQGDTYATLRILDATLVRGMGFMTRPMLAAKIFEFGIAAMYQIAMQNFMASLAQWDRVMQLPPAMRDAVITTEMREGLKKWVAFQNDQDAVLKELTASITPEAMEKLMNPGTAPVAEEAEQSPAPADAAVCAKCGQPFTRSNGPHEHKGRKYHADCLIDVARGETGA